MDGNIINEYFNFLTREYTIVSHNKAYLDLLTVMSDPYIENLSITPFIVIQKLNQDPQLSEMNIRAAQEDLGEKPNQDSEDHYHIALLYRIFLSHKIFQLFTLEQLMKILPSETCHRAESLEILEKIQELLDQIDPSTMIELYDFIQHNQGDPTTIIQSKIQIQYEYFYLYNILSNIMSLERDEVQRLHKNFPKLEPLAIVLLTNLSKYALSDAISVLNQVGSIEALAQYSNIQEMSKITITPQSYDVQQPLNVDLMGLEIEIIEQPPDRCVYKRNIKPPPTIRISGSYSGNDLYILPVLIRCDTREELPLVNALPVKVVPNKPYSFKKLKITQTSHQLNETLFSIRFELRHSPDHRPKTNFTIITSASTNPICVLSHSTQLKPSGYALPSVTEVVPPSGPPCSRVAILGANFYDSPTLRVKFGDIEVIPIVHGTKTLICTAPKHGPGKVIVSVCNDRNVWSDKNAEFIFEEDETLIGLSESSMYLSESGGHYGKADFEEIETFRLED